MNANEQFVPKWAEEMLSKKTNMEVELTLLRAFFAAWENLHSIPNKPENRRKAEHAAEKLVETARPIRALRGKIERVTNGN